MDPRETRREFFKSIREIRCNDNKRVGCVTEDHTRDYSLGDHTRDYFRDPIIDEVRRTFSGKRTGNVILCKKAA